MKISTEFDNEINCFINKFSARLFDGLAKIKASVQMNPNGEFRFPLIGVFSKHASLDYDVEGNNAIVRVNGDVMDRVRLTYQHFIKEKQGSLFASVGLDDYRYNFGVEINTFPPSLAQTSLSFPYGELNYVPKFGRDEEENTGLSGRVITAWNKNITMAEYQQFHRNVDLTYTFKDKLVTLSPKISFPSKEIHLNFKRKLGEFNKLSLLYSFNDVNWSAVFKTKPTMDLKVKAGYDSSVNLAWTGIWIGDEGRGCSKAPGKFKTQFMIQLPLNAPNRPVFLFKVKKRFDFFLRDPYY